MPQSFEIAGEGPFELEHLVLDVNGTLTDRGELLTGVEARLVRLREIFEIHLLSADTFGTLERLTARLRVEGRRIACGAEKREFVAALGADRCAAIGNGRNDAELLTAVRLGICVLGPEGTSPGALS